MHMGFVATLDAMVWNNRTDLFPFVYIRFVGAIDMSEREI